MTRDFTFEIYEKLLQSSLDAGYEHITIKEYLHRDKLPEQFIIHRHDVDRKPENSLAMAHLEAEYDISATYYFRTIEKTFRSEIIQEIENLGHEIGYHYEDMDRADGNVGSAHESFTRNLEHLRKHATVDTVCMHGNPLTRHDNRDIWAGNHGFEEYGLLGEAYLSIDFVDVTYFSDTGRTWKDGVLKVKDHPIGERKKQNSASTTQELIDLLKHRSEDRVCLLSHPNRWALSYSEWISEATKDAITNIGKLAIGYIK